MANDVASSHSQLSRISQIQHSEKSFRIFRISFSIVSSFASFSHLQSFYFHFKAVNKSAINKSSTRKCRKTATKFPLEVHDHLCIELFNIIFITSRFLLWLSFFTFHIFSARFFTTQHDVSHNINFVGFLFHSCLVSFYFTR